MGTTACSAPAPSTASTVTASAMRVTPPRQAAAPTAAYMGRETVRPVRRASWSAWTPAPSSRPAAPPAAIDGMNTPVAVPRPKVSRVTGGRRAR